jgi:C_GCAxxG_C_C family probable redox protein
MKRDDLLGKAFELGFSYEKKYRGCSQCSIAAIQDSLGLRNDYIFKAGSGLAAGGGLLRAGLCGAYSGGVMMMSSFFGRSREKINDDREEKYCSFRMAAALHDLYIEKYGSVLCSEIHENIFGRSFDLWDEKERHAFEEAGAHRDKCTTVVADASKWAVQLILDELEKRELTIGDFRYLNYPV